MIADGDDGPPVSPPGDPRGRNARDAGVHREALASEQARQVVRGLAFLEAELAIAEELVHHLLDQPGPGIDFGQRGLFERFEPLLTLEGWCDPDQEGGERECGAGQIGAPLRAPARRRKFRRATSLMARIRASSAGVRPRPERQSHPSVAQRTSAAATSAGDAAES